MNKIYIVALLMIGSAFTHAAVHSKKDLDKLPKIKLSASDTIMIDQSIEGKVVRGDKVVLNLVCDKKKTTYSCQAIETKKIKR